jgi:hypothetical protein
LGLFIADCRLASADCGLSTADWGLPIELPIADLNCRLPIGLPIGIAD